jgi:hypothetical protein
MVRIVDARAEVRLYPVILDELACHWVATR